MGEMETKLFSSLVQLIERQNYPNQQRQTNRCETDFFMIMSFLKSLL